ncbi:hypothetical protein DRH29_04070 [candidate division Kazan bacterium]|uniref:Uncharacterized protein n=1 Tax=candidate division Kazan bacterium TaxID=2202143 RepID=A0A420ZC10_UNCK3|nr:MAG: hypothetical protein DRH29_04070 [candidate division Kazan bacterium]
MAWSGDCVILRKDIEASARICARILNPQILAVKSFTDKGFKGAQGYARILFESNAPAGAHTRAHAHAHAS